MVFLLSGSPGLPANRRKLLDEGPGGQCRRASLPLCSRAHPGAACRCELFDIHQGLGMDIRLLVAPPGFFWQLRDQSSIGLKEKAFLGQVTPQAAHPMQLPGLSTYMNMRAESSSSTSWKPSTLREQAL